MKRDKRRRGAARKRVHNAKCVDCTKGEAMEPVAHAMHIPDSLHLERRHVCQPVSDEPVMLRDDNGHVYAVVDSPPESLWPPSN